MLEHGGIYYLINQQGQVSSKWTSSFPAYQHANKFGLKVESPQSQVGQVCIRALIARDRDMVIVDYAKSLISRPEPVRVNRD